MKVWRVQDSNNKVGKAGAVSPGYKADYPGEAEVLSLGFAPGKAYDSVGIGRHGNFLLWGWSASPSKMTEAGRRLFLNCISYIHKYDNKPFVKIKQVSMTRDEDMISMFGWMEQSPSRAKSYPPRFFAQAALDKYGDDIKAMRNYYEANIEFVYDQEGKFCVDDRLRSLGLCSNRQVGELKKLVGFLTDPVHADLAESLLLRYTNESFTTPEEWSNWFKENRHELFFSDSGGYMFYVMPRSKKKPNSTRD